MAPVAGAEPPLAAAPPPRSEIAPAPAADPGCYDAGPAVARIRAEAEALRSAAGDGKSRNPDAQGELDNALALLGRAVEALDAGRTFQSLERLAAARSVLDAILQADRRFASFKDGTAETCREGVAEAAASLEPLRAGLARPSATTLPAAARALRDDARTQSPILERTGEMWCAAGEFFSGAFYAANALAVARNAAMIEALPFPQPPPAPRVAPVGDALDRLEHDLAAAYRPPLSTERHRDFIMASSAAKAARDALAAGSHEAAVFEYLKAVQSAAPLLHAGAPLASLPDLRAESEAIRRRLGALPGDQSLGCHFLERARGFLEAASRADTPEEPQRSAAAALRIVLPEYFRLLEER